MLTATASGPIPKVAHPSLSARQKVLLVIVAVVFERLFWGQGLGLNGLIFTWLVVGMQLRLWPQPTGVGRPVWVAAGGALLSGGLILAYGSAMAGLAAFVSLGLLLAFARLPTLRSVGYALLTSATNLLKVGPELAQALWPAGQLRARTRRVWFYGRLLGLPLVAVLVFHTLFTMANPRYAQFSEQLLAAVGQWFEWFFQAISIGHLLFWLLAAVVAGGAVLRGTAHYFARREATSPEVITRQRGSGNRTLFRLPDLRKQYVMAMAVFGLLNSLLLVVNGIDVNWLWLGQHPATAPEMKQFVHEGTYVLIFSILLAIAIVLWAFRRNLNFYGPGLLGLRWMATAWVVQNVVLAISVGLRNYYYIVATGLAYKRIGVCAFLVLTIFGLFTIGLKIWQRRSVYSLIRLNGWAAYLLLLGLAVGNWEVWMARYNLQRRRLHIDLSFLLELPGRTLPVLQVRRPVLANPRCTPVLMRRRWAESSDIEVAPSYALSRVDACTRMWCANYRTHRSWQSWNYADWQAYRVLQHAPARP